MKRTESGFTTHNKLARLVTKRVSRPRGPSNGTICKWEKDYFFGVNRLGIFDCCD